MSKQYIATIEATHGGFINDNNTWYLENEMSDGVESWITPYKKPVLPHHDKKKDSLGYVIESRYISTKTDSSDNTPQGHIELKAVISDTDAIQKIKDGRYRTVSISADAKYAKCSICDHIISKDGLCEHKRGNVYDGKKCYWEIGKLNYKEVSPVNIPADQFASIIKLEEIEIEDMVFTDNVEDDNKINNTVKFTFVSDDNTKDKTIETADSNDNSTNGENMDEKEKELSDLKVQLSGMQALDEKVKTQDEAIETLEKEKQVLTDSLTKVETKNEDLRGQVHKNYVDKVYDLRKNLQRKDAMSLKDDKEIESYKADLAKRSDESLSDTIADLEQEAPVTVVDGKIDKSEGDDVVADNVQVADSANAPESKEDRVKRILSGNLDNSEED